MSLIAEIPFDRSRLRSEIRAMLDALDRDSAPAPADAVAARAVAETDIPALWGPGEPVASVEDISFETDAALLPVRIYRPVESVGTMLFFHGGGWVMGSIDTHDGLCRMLANRTPCTIVSIGYRKAPEHPFPAAVVDADAAVDWVLGTGQRFGLNRASVIVAGESAGATLATIAARHARDRGITLCGQMLMQPVTDLAMDTASYRAFASGFRLTAQAMGWLADLYVPRTASRDDPDVSPLKAEDLTGVAPALIVTADSDPLRDEGRAYAARLVQAGIDVTFVEWPGVVHGFVVMNAITPAAGEAVAEAAAWARRRFTKRFRWSP